MLVVLRKFFLVDDETLSLERGTTFWHYLFLALFFLSTRSIIIYVHYLQGRGLMDGAGNLALAEYIKAFGKLPLSEGFGRFFPGVPILIALLDSFVEHITISGFIVVWGTALLAVLLFHRLFQNFRMSVIHAVFLPAWLANTSTILGEGTALFLYLLFLFSTGLKFCSALHLALLFLSGYALVCRPSTALLIFPFLLTQFLTSNDKRVYTFALSSLLVSTPFLLYVVWAYFSTGEIFPQLELQKETFQFHTYRSQGYYPNTPLTWPGYALALGFFDFTYVSFLKKAINFVHIILVVVAAVNLLSVCRNVSLAPRHQAFYLPFTVTFFIVLLFTLMIGGPFGHTQFYRYIATHMNPIVIFALFDRYHLKWSWISAIALLNIVAACFAGSVGPF
ncbi:hypothetical protein OAO01_09360 [Oligoflexia bacterium]|nr:hypothetical protein [Oligoflexia bacterium]